jgi:hypothetical protein
MYLEDSVQDDFVCLIEVEILASVNDSLNVVLPWECPGYHVEVYVIVLICELVTVTLEAAAVASGGC